MSSTGKFSMLEFSMMYYRQNIDRYDLELGFSSIYVLLKLEFSYFDIQS